MPAAPEHRTRHSQIKALNSEALDSPTAATLQNTGSTQIKVQNLSRASVVKRWDQRFFVLRNFSLSASGWFPARNTARRCFFHLFFYTSFFKITFSSIISLFANFQNHRRRISLPASPSSSTSLQRTQPVTKQHFYQPPPIYFQKHPADRFEGQ